MRFKVITIRNFRPSEDVSERCIKSASNYGVTVEKYNAITPNHKPMQILKNEGIQTDKFGEIWSRTSRAASAFLSHYFLWKECVETNEEYTIFEHDAVVIAPLPLNVKYNLMMSIGAPSYGKYKIPPILGVNKLISKQYFPGAHAYMLKPKAAKHLVDQAKLEAMPTDVFLHNNRFPWLEEYYPWPVVAKDSFTTIQNENGIRAKHSLNDKYKIL